MKKQRLIHLVAAPALVIATLIAWHWLPPYLAHNPGFQLLVAILIVCEIAHFVLHDK